MQRRCDTHCFHLNQILHQLAWICLSVPWLNTLTTNSGCKMIFVCDTHTGLLEEKCSFWSFSALLRSNFKVNEWMWKWLSESHSYVKHSGRSSTKCSASNWLKQCFSTFVTCPHLWQYTGVLREGNLNFLQFCSVGHSAKIQQNSLESIGCCCLLFPPVSCQRCRCLAFVGRVCFCLTEHRQNFLSCSPFTALLNRTHTNTKPDLSFPLQSVASEE